MANTIKTNIALSGEDEYKKALDQITKKAKLLDSEMKTVTSSFNNTTTAQEKNEKVSATLSKQIELAKDKVELLAKMLDEAEQEFGDNEEAMSKYQIKLNQAVTELNKLTSAETNYEDAAEKATEKTSLFGEALKAHLTSEAIIAGVKKLGESIKDMVNSFVDGMVDIVNSYAEYEQLVGGIESLFGDSQENANKVLEAGGDAWKTLTMSASDYYESFSESFPLNEYSIDDENEAIEQTNRLLTLESDLSNTFGKDTSEYATAINWALKGTYSYLDNLGIGLKGTAEGFLEAANSSGLFAEQITDLDQLTSAEKLDVIEYYAAQYGVLGKTAAEAETTIQGSLKMLSATWDNLKTGLADDEANIEELVSNLITSFLTALDNIIPVVEQIMEAMPEAVHSIVDGLVEMLPELLNVVLEAGQVILEALPEIITTIVDFFGDNAYEIAEAGVDLFVSLLENMSEIVSSLVENIPVIIEALTGAILDHLPEFISAGFQLLLGLAKGIVEAIPSLISTAIEACSGLVSNILEFFGIHSPSKMFAGFGEMLMAGLGEGIEDNADMVEDAIMDVGEMTADTVTTAAGINNASSANSSYAYSGVTASQLANLFGKVDALGGKMEQMAIYLDGKTLVGGIATDMDKALGTRYGSAVRGYA